MTTEEIIAWKNFPNILEKARSKANLRYPSILEIDDDAEFGEYDINEAKRDIFIEGYLEAEKDLADVAQISSGPDGFFYGKGYEQAEKDLGWHPSTEHPPVDEEVIVLTDIITKGGLNAGFGKIAFGHIVNKDIAVDYDGWNIEGVRYWMPMPEIPKEK